MEGERVSVCVEDLPAEILHHIFSFTPPLSVVAAELVCISWHQIISSNHLWKELHKKHFGGKKKGKDKETITWKIHCLKAAKTAKSLSGTKLLKWCCASGNHVVLERYLRENNPSVTELDGPSSGSSLLYLALMAESAECVDLLALRGAALTRPVRNNKTPMDLAAEKGLLEIIEVLLRHGAGGDFVKVLAEQRTYYRANRKIKPILHQAAHGGHLLILRTLIERAQSDGQDIQKMVNTPDQRGFSPLHWAAETGQVEVIKYLISCGADINIRNSQEMGDMTPLFFAVRKKRVECVEFLLDNGAVNSLSHAGGPETLHTTPFHEACTLNSIDMAKVFLAKGVDPNLPGRFNRSPLHFAAAGAGADVLFIEFLMKCGTHVNTLSCPGAQKRGRTVVWELLNGSSWHSSRLGVLEYLLDHGADLTLDAEHNLFTGLLCHLKGNWRGPLLRGEDDVRMGPIFYAVKLLVEHGYKDVSDVEILRLAALGTTEFFEYMLSLPGAVTNPIGEESALHVLVREWHRASGDWGDRKMKSIEACQNKIKAFIAHGGDADHPNSRGEPPSYLFADNVLVLKFLLEQGADINYVSHDPLGGDHSDTLLFHVLRNPSIFQNQSSLDVVLELLKLGADLSWKNDQGQTVAEWVWNNRPHYRHYEDSDHQRKELIEVLEKKLSKKEQKEK